MQKHIYSKENTFHFFSGYVVNNHNQSQQLEILTYYLDHNNQCISKILTFNKTQAINTQTLSDGDLIIVKAELNENWDQKFFNLIECEKLELNTYY
ncbi:hypothetical protein OF377_00195 [Ureaplasma sp. ES3154-GEN]|uniref:hypothetical protein n=1 Tax=Ureaplasma sp. ES3154-GEN TaxID=2984844 RepID=UPI0021E76941|nr:hypothetical protein [Ureaplasma sp. ES3154-GEN]MCV3743308.1 hypothetical protein [Ureaplasma sp. ES3154-GEN]